MSITRRILESAQSGWSKLSSMVIVDDEPLSHVDPATLQAELVARKAARERLGTPVGGSSLAAMATSSSSAKAERERRAVARGSQVRRERAQREAAERRASDDAFQRMKAEAARGGGGASSARASASAGASGSARAPRPGSTEAQVAEWYKTLDLSPGADLTAIKTSYRKLMRKYHPDVHAGDAKKQKAATELSVRVTMAYNSLTAHLAK
ncbi:MAG: J domain-containing protein [Kofleriaceae bacterium]